MTMRIGAAEDLTRWTANTAWVHLHKDQQQLTADLIAGASPRVIAADKAAVVESREQVARTTGRHLVDITV